MTDQPIKAIETRYKGFRFRSRLEARWAVFLDTLGVKWEYEKEGYSLGDGVYYLPDFYLPDMTSWLEVKGRPFEMYDETWQKASLLSANAGELLPVGADEDWHPTYVYVFCGQFAHPNNVMGYTFRGLEHLSKEEAQEWFNKYPNDNRGFPDHCWWFQCPVCKLWQPGRTKTTLPCECIEVTAPGDQPDLWHAIEKAKQARFEHGERG